MSRNVNATLGEVIIGVRLKLSLNIKRVHYPHYVMLLVYHMNQ
jgi:hypothetical protein